LIWVAAASNTFTTHAKLQLVYISTRQPKTKGWGCTRPDMGASCYRGIMPGIMPHATVAWGMGHHYRSLPTAFYTPHTKVQDARPVEMHITPSLI